MNKKANSKLTKNSQNLRKNMTQEERHLWYDFLKNQTITFNRQKVIEDFIVDFYCASANLVIEIDGSQHYESSGKEKDVHRDSRLASLGLTVLRYSNCDINTNFEGVCYDISKHINTSSTASGPPSPQGEG